MSEMGAKRTPLYTVRPSSAGDFNDIRARIFVLTGAPFLNTSGHHFGELADLLDTAPEDIVAPADDRLTVTDHDAVDRSQDGALAERDGPVDDFVRNQS